MEFFTAFALKVIASGSMLIDHTGVIFDTPEYFRMIGRVAFPIYAYMIAQGCKYTNNIYRYSARLFIFALISQIPFSFAFFQGYQLYINIFFTLFLGVCCVLIYEKVKMKTGWGVAILPTLPLLWVAEACRTDYGAVGVGLIFIIYLAGPENRITRSVTMTAGLLILYWGDWIYFVFAMTAVVLVFLYNGKQGPRFKWAFYVFYPAHITALGLIRLILSV